MSNLIHKLYHPEIFQGHLEKQKYFEGWYYKFVSRDETQALAVIPGMAAYDHADRHAFIQVIDGVRQQTNYYRFDLGEFKADSKKLSIEIGQNHFSRSKVQLQLPELSGEIDIVAPTPIHTSLVSPGIMGWYSFVPGMQCYHGIVSLHHKLNGITTGTIGRVNWDAGLGYIEKDWGKSFPKSWIWVHGNNFKTSQRVSLMASVAHIPWMGQFFPGFIVALLVGDEQYRFATYNGSRIKCSVENDEVNLEFKKGKTYLSVKAIKGPTATLRSPISGKMTGKVNESLQARLVLVLKQGGQTIWKGSGTSAGLEVAGETEILETDHWRS